MDQTEKQGSGMWEMIYLALSAAIVAFAVTTYVIEGETALLFIAGPLWFLISLVATGVRLYRGHGAGQGRFTRYVKNAVYVSVLLVSGYYTAILLLAFLLFGSFT